MSRPAASPEAGASGEDVDLWLDEELFLDVRLDSGVWLEAESVSVRGRWLQVRFFTRDDLEPIWLNVDVDSHRLAELHSQSGAEAQARRAAEVARQAEVAAGGLAADQALDAPIAHEMYGEVLARNQLALTRMAQQAGDAWLTEQGQRRLQASEQRRGNNTPAAFASSPAAAAAAASNGLVESQSCLVPPVHGRPLVVDGDLMVDDDGVSGGHLSVSAVLVKFPLFDPHTHLRLVVPVRSPQCAHPEAFDLFTHIQYRMELSATQPIWTCPVCKCEAWPADLLVDPLLFHTLRLIEDGRLQQHAQSIAMTPPAASSTLDRAPPAHVPSTLTFTVDSPLMSSAAFALTLGAFDALQASLPKFGASPSSEFEERRLTLTLTPTSVKLAISTEADDNAQREARRHGARRARTMPTANTRRAADQGDRHDSDLAPSVDEDMEQGSPWKRPRNERAATAAAAPSSVGFDSPPAFGAGAASIPVASSSSSTAGSSFPWACWTDAHGLTWIDVRGGPDDVEGADRWANIRVKIESAHKVYQAVQEKHQLQAPPPPTPAAPSTQQQMMMDYMMQPFSPAAAAAATPSHLLARGVPSSSPIFAAAAAAASSRAAPAPARIAPPFVRAATLPARHQPRSSSPSASPAKKRDKLRRAESSAAAAAGGVAPVPSSLGASVGAPAPAPLFSLNTCSAYDLMSINGIGDKVGQRIVDARFQKWMTKKVKWNDRLAAGRLPGAPAPASSAISPGVPGAAGAGAGVSSVASVSMLTPCECETPQECPHVRAFTKLRSLQKVDGIGAKLFEKLQAHLTL